MPTDKQTEAQHTPGPWDYDWRGGKSPRAIRFTSPSGLLFYLGAQKISESDARLIAAAPDLLAMVKALLPWVETSPGFSGRENAPLLQRARAAIARAEGAGS